MTASTQSDSQVLHVFYNTVLSCQYVFKNGKVAPFINGRYVTDIASEIEELNAEISAKHPNIYIKVEEPTITKEELDPMFALKKKFFAEFAAQQALANNPESDKGNTGTVEGAKLANVGMVSTAKLVDVSASSNSAPKK